ncbi:hypothetical protein EDB19DRAFT_1708157 [Suillus lakei]|nr:hypothetical protein EDB19DRAFT_1708157 [Suillus lakei]
MLTLRNPDSILISLLTCQVLSRPILPGRPLHLHCWVNVVNHEFPEHDCVGFLKLLQAINLNCFLGSLIFQASSGGAIVYNINHRTGRLG